MKFCDKCNGLLDDDGICGECLAVERSVDRVNNKQRCTKRRANDRRNIWT